MSVEIVGRQLRSVYMEGGIPTYDNLAGTVPSAVDVTITFRTTGGAAAERLKLLGDPMFLHSGGRYEFECDPTDGSIHIHFIEPKPSEGEVRIMTDSEWRKLKKEQEVKE